jgi:hypothetical protein
MNLPMFGSLEPGDIKTLKKVSKEIDVDDDTVL